MPLIVNKTFRVEVFIRNTDIKLAQGGHWQRCRVFYRPVGPAVPRLEHVDLPRAATTTVDRPTMQGRHDESPVDSEELSRVRQVEGAQALGQPFTPCLVV